VLALTVIKTFTRRAVKDVQVRLPWEIKRGLRFNFCNPRSVHFNQRIVPAVQRRTVHVGQRAHPGKRFAVVALNYYLFCALNASSLSGAKVLEVPIPHPFEMRVVFETIACGFSHCAAVGAGECACELCEHDDASLAIENIKPQTPYTLPPPPRLLVHVGCVVSRPLGPGQEAVRNRQPADAGVSHPLLPNPLPSNSATECLLKTLQLFNSRAWSQPF
jgi:hypothetical protein